MHVVQSQQMAQISETRSPQGIAAVVPLLTSAGAASRERAIYLHEMQDPGNLGTILRTLAWFGGFRCLLSPDSVDVHNGKVVRASMGAIFHVPVEIDVPLDALSGALRAASPASICRASRWRRRASATSTATCSATRRAACRREALARWRAAFTIPGTGRDRIAERGGDREHLPVRAPFANKCLTPIDPDLGS